MWALIEVQDVNQQLAKHQKALCAHEYIQQHGLPTNGSLFDQYMGSVSLKPIGCSDVDDSAEIADVRDPPDFSWLAASRSAMVPVVSLTLAISLAVYGVVRAIGWVIDGFVTPLDVTPVLCR